MATGKRLLSILAGLVSGALIVVLFPHNKTRNSPRRLLKKGDVFAEPVNERFNEFIDIIAITYDDVWKTLLGSIEQMRTKSVETFRKIKTSAGRYVRAHSLT